MFHWLAHKLLTIILARGIIIPIKVVGREHLKGLRSCIIVPSHQDGSDTVILVWCLPFRFWFVLRDDFGEPIRSLLIRYLLMALINREKPTRQQIRKITNLLKSGKPIVMFAEGTRSESLRRAKTGFASLARTYNVPVVPVSISGTCGLLRKDSWRREIIRAILRRRPPIKVTIHPPVYYNKEEHESPQAFADQVMTTIASGLKPQERGYYADRVG